MLRQFTIGMVICWLISITNFAYAANNQQFQLYDVADLLRKYKIQESSKALMNIVTDEKNQTHAFLFMNKSNGDKDISVARIFLNEKKIFEGEWRDCAYDRPFKMTADAHVLYVPDCQSLYLDSTVIDINPQRGWLGNNYAYENGKLYFIDGDSIKKFDRLTEKTQILFQHRGKKIYSLIVQDNHVAYLVEQGIRVIATLPSQMKNTPLIQWGNESTGRIVYRAYLDGEQIQPNVEPYDFLLSDNNIVYSHGIRSNGNHVIYAGKKMVVQSIDPPFSLFADSAGGIWYATCHVNEKNKTRKCSVFNNGKEKPGPKSVFGVTLLAAENNHFAYLGKNTDTASGVSLRLVNDGNYTGRPFFFKRYPYVNFNPTLFFGINGKIYLLIENVDGNMMVLENGVPMLTKEFKKIFMMRKESDGVISVYGTKS